MAEPDIPVSADAVPTQPVPTSADEPQSDGMLKDTLEGVATGATKGINELVQTADTLTFGGVNEVGDWLNENVADLGTLGVNESGELVYYRAAQAIKEAKEAGLERGDPAFNDFVKERVTTTKLTDGLQTISGNISSSLTQFAAGWLPANRMMKLLPTPTTTAGKVSKLAGEGAIAEVIAFDKYEDRLSNIIEDYPALENPVTAFLAADPDDAAALAVLKQATEGVMTEALFLPFVAGLKALRANRNNFEETDRLVQEAAEEASALAPQMSNEIEQSLKSWVEANSEIAAKYAEAVPLTGAARTQTRKAGRDEAVAALDDAQLEDLQAKGGGIQLTNEAMQQAARRDIGKYLAPYSDNVTLGVSNWIERFGGDVVRARRTLVRATEMVNVADVEFSKVATKFQTGQATEEELKRAFKNVVGIVNIARGGFSEAGRMLEFSKVVDGWNVNTLNTAIEAGTALQGNLRGRQKFMSDMAKYAFDIQKGGAKAVGVVNELFINSILSGLKTHLVNIGSNTFTMATMPLERFSGALIRGDKTEMMKALRTYQGMYLYSWESLKAGMQALKKGQTILDVDRSIMEEGVQTGEIPWVMGQLIRLPTRALAAEDEVFKQLNFRAFAFAEAMADGKALGYRGSDLNNYVTTEVNKAVDDQIKANITKTTLTNPIAERAIEAARTATFTQGVDGKSINERASQGYTNLVNGLPILRQISPFVRTPLNIASYTLQRSPLAPLSGRWRRDMRQGGQAEAQAIIRWGVGMSLADYFYGLAQQGAITGTGAGLSVDQVRAMEDMYGYKRNAIYDGEEYLEVSRLSPATDLMTIMASIYELNKYGATKEADELASAVTVVLADFARDKTFLQGVNDMMNAIEDPERYLTSYLGSKAAAMVPYSGLLKSLNGDPKLRKIYEVAEGYKKTIPGLSKDLDPVRNILGEQKLVPEFWGIDFASPIGHTVEKDDPIALAFKQAADAGTPYNIPMPSKNKAGIDLTDRAFSNDFQGKPLNPKRVRQTAYDMWLEFSGKVPLDFTGKGDMKTLREALTAVVSDPRFEGQATGNFRIGDKVYTGSRADYINQTITAYRNIAWDVMVGKDPYAANAASGIFDSKGFLVDVKGAFNPRLATAFWTNNKVAGEAAKSKEGQEWMKGNQSAIEDRIKGIFSQGSN